MNAGRAVGTLLLAQGIGGFLVNFVLLQPAISPPGFLVNAAPHATRVGVSALMALWFLALGIAAISLAAVENGTVMSLLSLSKAYAASGADPASFEAVRGVVAASRNWAHYSHLVVGGATLLTFYAVLYRFTLVPRVLAAFGLVAVLLQLLTVSRPFFGAQVIFFLLAPLGLANLAVAVWLLVKGFADPDVYAASRV
jgi:hypothetical protein